jgi:hypothetical protein
MSKYAHKPHTSEEKRRAVDQYSEKITYSARYASELTPRLAGPYSAPPPFVQLEAL